MKKNYLAIAAMALFLSSCGCNIFEEDSDFGFIDEATDSGADQDENFEESFDPTDEEEDADEGGDQSEQGGVDAVDQGGGEQVTSGSDHFVVGPATDALIDSQLESLDSATFDGTRQCIPSEAFDQSPIAEVGLRPGWRSPILGDGLDVFIICAVEASPPDLPQLQLLGPSGEVVVDTNLRTEESYELFDVPVFRDVVSPVVQTVFVAVDSVLLPVGYRWEYQGYSITTIYFALPSNRSSGPWTVVYGDSGEYQAAVSSAVCGDGPVGSIWLNDPNLDVFTFTEEYEAEFDPDPDARPSHCRSAPDVVGLSLAEAESVMSQAYAVVSGDSVEIELNRECSSSMGPGETSVFAQSPTAYADVGQVATPSLSYATSCE